MISLDVIVAFVVGGVFGWFGGYCYGWLMGTKDTERRWSDAVARKMDYDAHRLHAPLSPIPRNLR